MPLENLESIDIVLGADAEGRIGLLITDAGVTRDPVERLRLLKRKLGVYVGAIMNGTFEKDHPDKRPQDYFIKVVTSLRPSPEMAGISYVQPTGDDSCRIEVLFQEWPKDSWDKETHSGEPSNEMRQLIELAFDIGRKWLDEGVPLFAVGVMDAQPKMVQPTGVKTVDDLQPWLEEWVASEGDGLTHCALVCVAQVKRKDGETWALIGRFFERGQPAGLILGQPLSGSSLDDLGKAAGDLFFVDGCPNVLP